METIIATLINNPVLFGLAIIVNVFVSIFKDVTEGICIGKGEDPSKGVSGIIFRNLLMVMVLVFAFAGTFTLCQMGFVVPLDNSYFATSVVVSIMSIVFYNVGIKEVMEWLKGKFIKKGE